MYYKTNQAIAFFFLCIWVKFSRISISPFSIILILCKIGSVDVWIYFKCDLWCSCIFNAFVANLLIKLYIFLSTESYYYWILSGLLTPKRILNSHRSSTFIWPSLSILTRFLILRLNYLSNLFLMITLPDMISCTS